MINLYGLIQRFLTFIPQNPDQMQAVFQQLEQQWGRVDTLVHCLAFVNKADFNGLVELAIQYIDGLKQDNANMASAATLSAWHCT